MVIESARKKFKNRRKSPLEDFNLSKSEIELRIQPLVPNNLENTVFGVSYDIKDTKSSLGFSNQHGNEK